MRLVASSRAIIDNPSAAFDRPDLLHRSPRAQAARKLRVLLVEDDEADAYLIRRALAGNPRIGEIVRAQDGIEALALIDRGTVKPDLAIVDLHMPRKDGFALLREFATREAAGFPSVVLTSSRAGADALRSKMRGAVEFLTKPNSAKKLSAALDRVVAGI